MSVLDAREAFEEIHRYLDEQEKIIACRLNNSPKSKSANAGVRAVNNGLCVAKRTCPNISRGAMVTGVQFLIHWLANGAGYFVWRKRKVIFTRSRVG